jgi:hypothetical protein
LRTGVLVTPGRDRPELVEAAFERHHLLFLPRWAAENPKRAVAIAESAKDATRRHAGMALVLPYLAKADPRQAEQWLWTLSALDQRVETSADLEFYVALVRARFALDQVQDTGRIAAAMQAGERLLAKRNASRPLCSADGAAELHDLAKA